MESSYPLHTHMQIPLYPLYENIDTDITQRYKN